MAGELVERVQILGGQDMFECGAHPAQYRVSVSTHGGSDVDIEFVAAHLDHLETGATQILAPVGPPVPPSGRYGLVASRFESRCTDTDVVGQEAWLRFHLGDHHHSGRFHRVEQLPEYRVGILDVMQGQRRPAQIDRTHRRQPCVEVHLDGSDPIIEPVVLSGLPDPAEHSGRSVESHELGVAEPAGQGECARARPRADVDDDAWFPRELSGDPVEQRLEVGPMHLGVEVEHLCHRFVVGRVVRCVSWMRGMGVVVHDSTLERIIHFPHTLLPMEQESSDLDRLIRQRIRSLRLAQGWTLDALAARCHISPSNLSRIETGRRRIALDQLVPIARALDTTIDQLVESGDDQDVVIRPQPCDTPGYTTWLLSRERSLGGVTVAKMRITLQEPRPADTLPVHPGHEWFTVLSGTARLQLGERTILIQEGNAAEFSTMTPHAISAHDGPVEILTILDHNGERAHLRSSGSH